MIKTAVILAAGLGSRLKEITKDKPKGCICIDDIPIIERSILLLIELGISNIIIGTGYLDKEYEKRIKKYPQINCIKNDHYKDTGSMYTLYNLKEHVNSDFLLLESDLIYEKKALLEILGDNNEAVILASEISNSSDAVFIESDQQSNLINMSKEKELLRRIDAEFVGISKINLDTFKKMCDYFNTKILIDPKINYEDVLLVVSKGAKIYVHKVNNLLWSEIDDENHLQRVINEIYPQIKVKEKIKGNN